MNSNSRLTPDEQSPHPAARGIFFFGVDHKAGTMLPGIPQARARRIIVATVRPHGIWRGSPLEIRAPGRAAVGRRVPAKAPLGIAYDDVMKNFKIHG